MNRTMKGCLKNKMLIKALDKQIEYILDSDNEELKKCYKNFKQYRGYLKRRSLNVNPTLQKLRDKFSVDF